MGPRGVTRDALVEQAVSFAKLLGWVIAPGDCRVQFRVSDRTQASYVSGMPSGPDQWMVVMLAQPEHNPRLRAPMPVSCRVEWLGERLCATQFSEPSDREPYLYPRDGSTSPR